MPDFNSWLKRQRQINANEALAIDEHGRPIEGGGAGNIEAAVTITTPTDDVALEINGVAGQTDNILEIYPNPNEVNETNVIMDRYGNLYLSSGGTWDEAKVQLQDANLGQVHLDSWDGVIIAPSRSSATAILVNNQTGGAHTGDSLRVVGSNGDILTIDPNGYLLIANHAAPADGALAAGECALWFDQTNGAAKLMIKAKQANGTVVTGSVNLT